MTDCNMKCDSKNRNKSSLTTHAKWSYYTTITPESSWSLAQIAAYHRRHNYLSVSFKTMYRWLYHAQLYPASVTVLRHKGKQRHPPNRRGQFAARTPTAKPGAGGHHCVVARHFTDGRVVFYQSLYKRLPGSDGNRQWYCYNQPSHSREGLTNDQFFNCQCTLFVGHPRQKPRYFWTLPQ